MTESRQGEWANDAGFARGLEEGRVLTGIYCPACGGTEGGGAITPFEMAPGGELEFMCSQCETKFIIRFDYSEVAEEAKP